MAKHGTAKAPLHRHMQFAVSASIGVFALAVALLLKMPLAFSIGANVFFISYLMLVLAQMPRLTADYLSKNARKTDQPVQIIFIVTIVVVGVALVALFQLINAQKNPHTSDLLIALASVPLGWMTIHTMSALHYAHLYWLDDEADDTDAPVGGLDFPGDTPPCGIDFLYFSTVIGMTAQTADTGITTSRMRRVVLAHSILSFFFNTVILAAAVNVVVSLGGPSH